jgi:hypothetical protein
MPTLTLDDDELRALCDLLTDVTRQPNRFPLSPRRRAWLSALEKLAEAVEGGRERGRAVNAQRCSYSISARGSGGPSELEDGGA